jgi:leader peptidase (prepilin peptidase)/N-methyltransferase
MDWSGMNGALVLTWAVLGLVMGALFAPSAAWLADVPQRRLYRQLVSAATAITFAVLAQQYPSTPVLLALSVFAAVGVLLAAIDVLAHRLPRALIWPTCATVSALLTTEIIGGTGDAARLLRAGAAAATLAGGYLVVALASRGGLGAGDVRAAFLAGGVLGWHGWPTLVAGTVLGFLMSAVGAALIGRIRCRAAIPHGPGMLAGAFVALLL